jgi:hypothetical protein
LCSVVKERKILRHFVLNSTRAAEKSRGREQSGFRSSDVVPDVWCVFRVPKDYTLYHIVKRVFVFITRVQDTFGIQDRNTICLQMVQASSRRHGTETVQT